MPLGTHRKPLWPRREKTGCPACPQSIASQNGRRSNVATSLTKFQFTVVGKTRDEVNDKMEEVALKIITEEGGEPWLVTQDETQKVAVNERQFLMGDPNAAFYVGNRTLLFTGPNKLVSDQPFHDGYRPQGEGEDGPPSEFGSF